MKTEIEALTAVDLRAEAQKAQSEGVEVAAYKTIHGSGTVETLVVDGLRAGQVTNADAVWGDWDDSAGTIALDSGQTVDLDGNVRT